MGLYDRHYIRDVEPQRGAYGRGGWQSLRMLSVNTWIIVICVGVFVIDGFLPWRDVLTDQYDPPSLKDVPTSMMRPGPAVRAMRTPAGQVIGPKDREMVDAHTGAHLGWVRVYEMSFLQSQLHFSTRLFLWPHLHFWRLIGFQFLHASPSHLFFNMLGLYFFGSIVEQYLGAKRYLAFYLLCGIFGALMYLLLNLCGYLVADVMKWDIRIPGLLFDDPSTPLVGASAGIFGVLIAGAFIAPRAVVLLFFVIPMQLKTLAYVLVGVAIFSLFTGSQNAGGEAGHLGGAIAGWYFIRHPYHLHNFFDVLGRVDPTSHHYRHGKPPKGFSGASRAGRARIEEIDRILAKINAQGIQSLTESEKRTLREASRQGA
jgi:membrane associated rhomboid family serine protease